MWGVGSSGLSRSTWRARQKLSRDVQSALGTRVWSSGDKCGIQWLAHGTESDAAGQNHVGVKRGEEKSEAEALQRCGAEEQKTHAPFQVPARPANAVDNPAL